MAHKASLLALALLLAACTLPSPIGPTMTPASPTGSAPSGGEPSYRVAAFYYPWYGTPQTDGKWIHWNQNGHTPPGDIGSDYYPVLGPYSSDDPAVVEQHMKWLRQAGVGVIIVSWWGKGSGDEKAVPLILQTAAKNGIKVTFHIEPYSGRTADGLVADIKYLYQQYGSSAAFFRSTATSNYSPGSQPKGMFFVWCINYASNCGQQPKVTPDYWQAALDAIHALPGGALVIANTTDGSWISGGHFDGLYNYTSLSVVRKKGFSWAHTVPAGTLYIPSVIPGFSARRVGYPSDTNVDRNDGQTYGDQWTEALGTGVEPAMVTITSFNEWHEGTMIEPAATGKNDGHGNSYQDFGTLAPDGYLNLTREWVGKFEARPHASADTYHARVQITTTSDWTTVSLLEGGQWLRPALVSSSDGATQAGFADGDNSILTQSLDDANAGKQVEMMWDLDLVGLQPGGTVRLQIDRGNIGATQVSVYNYVGEQPVLAGAFSWAGVTTGRNSNVVALAADQLIGK